MTNELKIMYHDNKYGEVKRLEKIAIGDWIDVYAAQDTLVRSIFDVRSLIEATEKELNFIMKMLIELEEVHDASSLDEESYDKIVATYKSKFEYFTKQIEDLKKPVLIPLGFSAQLPEGSEAFLVPRSSTFKSFNLLQVNSPGVIDESYCGDNDEWKMPVIAIYDSIDIQKGDKIGQIKIQSKMPEITITEVTSLGNPDRGGFGKTGTK